MTESHRTLNGGRQGLVWPRWCAWMLGDPEKLSPGLCFFFGAVSLYSGALAIWQFHANASGGWVYVVQTIALLVMVGGLVHLWAGFRLRRHRSAEP